MAFVGLHVHLQLGTLEAVATAVDQDMARGERLVGALVEFDPIRANDRVVAPELHLAFDHGEVVGLAFHALAPHKGRQLLARFWRQRLLQQGARFESDRFPGIGILRPHRHSPGTQRQHRNGALHGPGQAGRFGTGAARCTRAAGKSGDGSGSRFQGGVWQNGRL